MSFLAGLTAGLGCGLALGFAAAVRSFARVGRAIVRREAREARASWAAETDRFKRSLLLHAGWIDYPRDTRPRPTIHVAFDDTGFTPAEVATCLACLAPDADGRVHVEAPSEGRS